MQGSEINLLMGLCGLISGGLLGAAARYGGFCTFGAIEDGFLARDFRRLRAWALAVSIAILLVGVMQFVGVGRIEESFYLAPRIAWLSIVVGGLLFGYGMAMVGTCGLGSLVRLGGGDLRSLVIMIVMGLFAYMTARGLLGLIRINWLDPVGTSLESISGQGLAHIAAKMFGVDLRLSWLVTALSLVTAIWIWCFNSRKFRVTKRLLISAFAGGFAIAFGFFATGYLGDDPFNPQRVVSSTFALPPGEALVYLMTFTGAHLDFGIGSVAGVVLGAFAVAAGRKQIRFEAFDDHREMRRHLFGAALMGFGGVTAMGCTIGQGMSAMAVMSVSAPLVLASIFLGAWIGLHSLMEGSLIAGLRIAMIDHWRG